MATSTTTGDEPSIEVVVERIGRLNAGLAEFWKASHGWAPTKAAEALAKARLDRQVSLSATLLKFAGEKMEMGDGDLVLAWANLGALLEGSLKTFLSVYRTDYDADAATMKAFVSSGGTVKEPEGLTLGTLRIFFQTRDLFEPGEAELAKLIQDRRNTIHAFADKPIGTRAEFHGALRGYLRILKRLSDGLPYPEDLHRPRWS